MWVGKNLPAKREDDPQSGSGEVLFGVWCAEDDPQCEGAASCFFRGKSVKSLVMRKGCGVVER